MKVKNILLALVAIGIVVAALMFLRGDEDTWLCQNGAWVAHGKPRAPQPTSPCGKETNMKITSTAFADATPIPARYSCQGENVSPPLALSGIPSQAVSLALTVDDPDAPVGVFHHWIVWNIDPKTTEIAEGDVPAGGVTGTNSAGREGYTAPCPPTGSHRYIFTLYALDTKLSLGGNADRKAFDAAISGHVLGETSLTGTYQKQ